MPRSTSTDRTWCDAIGGGGEALVSGTGASRCRHRLRGIVTLAGRRPRRRGSFYLSDELYSGRRTWYLRLLLLCRQHRHLPRNESAADGWTYAKPLVDRFPALAHTCTRLGRSLAYAGSELAASTPAGRSPADPVPRRCPGIRAPWCDRSGALRCVRRPGMVASCGGRHCGRYRRGDRSRCRRPGLPARSAHPRRLAALRSAPVPDRSGHDRFRCAPLDNDRRPRAAADGGIRESHDRAQDERTARPLHRCRLQPPRGDRARHVPHRPRSERMHRRLAGRGGASVRTSRDGRDGHALPRLCTRT